MGKFTYLTDFQPPPKKKTMEKKHMETPAVGLQNAPIPTHHVETRRFYDITTQPGPLNFFLPGSDL